MLELTKSEINEAQNAYRGEIEIGMQLAESAPLREFFTGDLSLEDDECRAQTAILMENCRRWLAGLHENVRSVTVGGFQDYLLPIIRASFPNNPIRDLVSVQPMTRRNGTVFWLNYLIGTTKGAAFKKGDKYFDANSGWQGVTDYTDEHVTDETQPDTAAASATTSGQTQWPYARPGTVRIVIDDTTPYVLTDDSNGGLVKQSGGALTVSSSSFNYVTGVWTVTMSAPLPATETVTITYDFDGEQQTEIPKLTISLASSSIESKRRALAYNYSAEAEQDFMAEWNMNLDRFIVNGCSQALIAETAGEIVKDLWSMAGAAVATFSLTIPSGVTKKEHFSDITYELNTTSGSIYDATQRAEGNWLIVDIKAASIIKTIGRPQWEPSGAGPSQQGLVLIGTLDGLPVYQYKQLASMPGASSLGNILMGYKGPEFWDAGYVWAPYQALYMSVPANAGFITDKALATRYAKKRVNANMYKRINIVA